MARLGRTPRRFHFPADPRTYFELQKLNSPDRDDFIAKDTRRAMPSEMLRFIWDAAVTGFCLKSEQGYVSYPASNDDRRNVKEKVWEGLEDAESIFLQRAFLLQNNLVMEERVGLIEAALMVGVEGLSASLKALWEDAAATPSAEQEAAIKAIIGETASVGEVLGNSPASSATSLTADEGAGAGTDAPKPGDS